MSRYHKKPQDLLYSRITQAPEIFLKMRKSKIAVTPVRKLENMIASAEKKLYGVMPTRAFPMLPVFGTSSAPVRPTPAVTAPAFRPSFLQMDPYNIRAGGYLTKPLRRPPMAYVNVVESENIPGIIGRRKAKDRMLESLRLEKEFDVGVGRLAARGAR